MSRIGKLPVKLPAGTEAKIENGFFSVKGPKGELKKPLNKAVEVEIADGEIKIKVANPEKKKERSLWGLWRSLVNNMVSGVNAHFEKKLEINGVGYHAQVNGRKLTFTLGYSHPIDYELPEGITAKVEKNILTISGADKEVVGETAANIRKFRKPEPYKGTGIKYADEIIKRKVGKAAAKSA